MIRAFYICLMSDKKKQKKRFAKALGERIKSIREEQEKSLLDIAYVLQIEPNSLRRYERGDTLMNSYYLVKLAEILDISIDNLVKEVLESQKK